MVFGKCLHTATSIVPSLGSGRVKFTVVGRTNFGPREIRAPDIREKSRINVPRVKTSRPICNEPFKSHGKDDDSWNTVKTGRCQNGTRVGAGENPSVRLEAKPRRPRFTDETLILRPGKPPTGDFLRF